MMPLVINWRVYYCQDVYLWIRAAHWSKDDHAFGAYCYLVRQAETGAVIGVCTES